MKGKSVRFRRTHWSPCAFARFHTEAKECLKLAAPFQFTYLGAPMVYYRDEAAINSPSLANGGNVPEDDPYNRAPYPWDDESGSTSVYSPADVSMIGYYSTLARLRQETPALRTGDFVTLLTGDTSASSSDNNTYAFARIGGDVAAIVALNNDASSNTARVPVSAYYADGAQLQDALSGAIYTVSGGTVNLMLNARCGAILLPAPTKAVRPMLDCVVKKQRRHHGNRLADFEVVCAVVRLTPPSTTHPASSNPRTRSRTGSCLLPSAAR